MNNYDAIAIAEGFYGEDISIEKQLEAWQHLIDTGLCWQLQGWFGRTASKLIASGFCKPANNNPE